MSVWAGQLPPEQAWLTCALPAAQQCDPQTSSVHPAAPQSRGRFQEQRPVLSFGASALRCLSPRFFLCVINSCRDGLWGSGPMHFLGLRNSGCSTVPKSNVLQLHLWCSVLTVFTVEMAVVMPICILEHKAESHKSFPTLLLFWNMGYVCYLAGRLCFFLNVNSGLFVYKIP